MLVAASAVPGSVVVVVVAAAAAAAVVAAAAVAVVAAAAAAGAVFVETALAHWSLPATVQTVARTGCRTTAFPPRFASPWKERD